MPTKVQLMHGRWFLFDGPEKVGRFDSEKAAVAAAKARDGGADDDETPNLDRMNKAELVAVATAAGLVVDDSMTKAEIVDLIEDDPESD